MTSSFFIIGIPRSGTTLLEKILDNHSLLGVCPESSVFKLLKRVNAIDHFSSSWHYNRFMNSILLCLKKFNDPAFDTVNEFLTSHPNYRGSTRQLLTKLSNQYLTKKGKTIFGEKTPEHLFELSTIQKVCPSARLIFIIRHPFDIICSINKMIAFSKSTEPHTDDLIMQAAIIVKHGLNTLFDGLNTNKGNSILIKYENLVRDPDPELISICKFLDVPFESEMIHFDAENYFQAFEKSQSIVHPNLTKPISSKSVNKYQKILTPSQLKILEGFLRKEFERIPYTFSHNNAKINWKQRLLLMKFKLKYLFRGGIVNDFRVRLKLQIRYLVFSIKNVLKGI